MREVGGSLGSGFWEEGTELDGEEGVDLRSQFCAHERSVGWEREREGGRTDVGSCRGPCQSLEGGSV